MNKKCRLINTLCVALTLAGTCPSNGARADASARGLHMQGQVVGVGVLPFQNDTGKEVSADFGQKTARELQQKLAAAHKDLLPRVVGAEGDAQATLGIEELAALGKSQGLKFVVRGGLLALDKINPASAGMQTNAQLYAEIVSVERGDLAGVRAEASGVAPSAALSLALDQLALEIHRAVVSPAAAASAAQASDGSGADDAAAIEAAEADDELMQLVAQAESLASSGVGSSVSLGALSGALKNLKGALAAKAAAMERAEDTAQADVLIATRRQELEAAINALTEEVAAAEMAGAMPAGEEQYSGEKKGLMSSIDSFMGDALSILQKIQEMRMALAGAGGEPAPGEDVGYYDQSMPADPVTEEVSGVVTEDGEPVEGVVVTEAESGVSATTGPDGFYNLKGIPAGRLTQLVLTTKSGKKQANAQLNLVAGRPALADFELKRGAAQKTGGLRIIPSTVVVRPSKARPNGTGALAGVVRDARGRPVARALVTLENLAMARTDSAGRYKFAGVPVGRHRLNVYKSGLRLKSESVEVGAKKTSATKTDFAAGDRLHRERLRSAVLSGAGTTLRGTVTDADRRPLAGARVTALLAGGAAASTASRRDGSFELRDLKPGQYRVLAAKAGYAAAAESSLLRGGSPALLEFRMKRIRPEVVERALAKLGSSGGAVTPGGTSQPPVVTQGAPVRGVVTDAKTGRPVAGATLTVAGRPSVVTRTDGSYTLLLPPGSHRLVVRKSAFADAAAVVRVGGGAVTQNFKLAPRASAVPPIRLPR